MKKIIKTFISIILVFLFCIIFFVIHLVRSVNLDFTEKILLNYEYGDKNIHVEITDKDDLDNLIRICKGTAINDFSVPSCSFGTPELIFEGKGKKIYLYPACDSCEIIRFGKKDKFFHHISETDRKNLEKILEKYGATFPCI